MSKVATLEIDGKKYEFPIIVGTENEVAIDIKNLRGESGVITLDPGFKNTGSCESAITFLDGEEGCHSLADAGITLEEAIAGGYRKVHDKDDPLLVENF